LSVQSGQAHDEIMFRHPDTEDGKHLWEITRHSGTLDLNSPYHYLIMCRHFGSTSVVAEINGTIVGFVTAYIPPESRNTLFVWQIAVNKSAQGKGLAKKMLVFAFKNAANNPLAFLEATITPSNTASIHLFSSVAQAFDAPFDFSETYFSEEDFGTGAHEPETLVRIGPIKICPR
jgi:L-2,4-diaminobutyric acid acetyltransferase